MKAYEVTLTTHEYRGKTRVKTHQLVFVESSSEKAIKDCYLVTKVLRRKDMSSEICPMRIEGDFVVSK